MNFFRIPKLRNDVRNFFPGKFLPRGKIIIIQRILSGNHVETPHCDFSLLGNLSRVIIYDGAFAYTRDGKDEKGVA